MELWIGSVEFTVKQVEIIDVARSVGIEVTGERRGILSLKRTDVDAACDSVIPVPESLPIKLSVNSVMSLSF